MLWLLTNDASDVAPVGNVLSDTYMNGAGEAAVNISFTVPGNATRAALFRTVANHPNNPDFQDGTATIYVKIITGFSNVQCAVNLIRDDSAGVAIEQQTLTAEQLAVSGTTLTFTMSSLAWTAGSVTDRYRLRIQFRTTNATSRTPVFEVGTTTSSRLDSLVVDEVQAIGTGSGGGAFAAPMATLANLNATLVAGATEAATATTKAALRATLPAGAAFAAATASRASITGAGRAGATFAAPSSSRANLTASGASGAAEAATGRGTASLAGSVPAGAAFTGGAKGRANMAASGPAGAVARGALGKVAQMLARAVGGSNFRAFSVGNKAQMTAALAAGAAGSGIVKGTASMAGRNVAGASASATASSVVTGAVGCFVRIVQAVRDRYVAQIEVLEGVETLHDNEPPADMDDFDIWVRFSIDVNPTVQQVLGAVPAHRYLGEATARIFLRAGLGDRDAWALADAIDTAFRGLTVDEIVYTPPPYPTVRGLTGDRWEVDVSVPFYSACEEAALV